MSRRTSLALLIVGCLPCAALVRAASTQSLEGAALGQDADRRPWRVPTRKARLSNPVPRSDAGLATGKQLYTRECASCHGSNGRGDGSSAAEVLGGVPTFQDAALAAQSDGALFYKIVTGRDPMPGYRMLLEEEDVWKIVHYLRVLAPPPRTEPRFMASAQLRKGVSTAFAHYAAATRALASGDAPLASSNAAQLVRSSEDLASATEIHDDQRATWLADLADLGKMARELASVQVLADQRGLHQKLSDAMRRLVGDFGHAESDPLYLLQRTERSGTRTWLGLEATAKDPNGSAVEPARAVRLLGGQSLPDKE